MLSYDSMPSLERWRRDSSVTLAVRNRDRVLTSIDQLIGSFERTRDHFQALGLGCYLFFDLDYWLKMYQDDPTMDKGRAPAIEALYKFVAANYLCRRFNCSVNTLPRELELLFGRELSGHGRTMDLADRAAEYMQRSQAARYKLIFRNGRAYQYPWWQPGPPRNALELADSRHAAAPDTHEEDDEFGDTFNDFGFFTMSMSRDLYMTTHTTAKRPKCVRVHAPTPEDPNNITKLPIYLKEPGIYHSSYLAGVAAMFAGSMRINDGVINAIRSNSGHYMPADTNTALLLRLLLMVGIPIGSIKIFTYEGYLDIDAPSFLGKNGSWEQIAATRQANLWRNHAAAMEFEVQKYMREHRVDETTARQKVAERQSTINVGNQRVIVRPLEPGPKKPTTAPVRPPAAWHDLE